MNVSIGLATGLIFGALLVCLMLGVPVTFFLGGIAVWFTYFLWGPQGFYMVAGNTMSQMRSLILIAIPMFIFMANMLQRSGAADELYEAMYRWMGPVRGGLAMGTVMICVIFAALSGVSAAATITMGLIALPSMLKRGYDKRLVSGCIQAGGALGILIPPSVPMIMYALVAGESVGRLFAGGVFPGLILASLFIIYIGVRAAFQPSLGPPVPPEARASWKQKLVSLNRVILPVMLITVVMGGILTGATTPTEASAVGALGAIIVAAIHRRLTWDILKETCYRTFSTSVMILWIIIGAACFASVYMAIGASEFIAQIMSAMPGGRWGALIAMQATLFFLGMALETAGIIMICAPLYVPIIKALGFPPIWFGVLFVINLEMAFLTPPYGINLFYMKAIVPKEITMGDLYRSVIPFVSLQMFGLILVMLFPQLVLWLPNMLFGS